jgi:hypothetical protein
MQLFFAGGYEMARKTDRKVPQTRNDIRDESEIATSILQADGSWRRMTPEEYALEPKGRVFIGIKGFRPQPGKSHD